MRLPVRETRFTDSNLFLAHSPDIICITETWLSPDFLDSKLTLPNYVPFRLAAINMAEESPC